jgi:AraC-like DNA-binding protein
LAAARFRAVPPARFAINRRVDWLCRLLLEQTERGGPGGRAYFEHLAAALLLSVASQADPRLPEAGDAGAQWQRVQPALAFMEVNFASKLSLEQLAATSGLSAFHFSRLFCRLVGTSPHRYLLSCRLRHARALLSTAGPGRSIGEVAAECGFADQSHFGRQFRRAYGVSPGQFPGGARAARIGQRRRARTFYTTYCPPGEVWLEGKPCSTVVRVFPSGVIFGIRAVKPPV